MSIPFEQSSLRSFVRVVCAGVAAAAVAGLASIALAESGDAPSTMRLVPIASGLTVPVFVASPPNDPTRLFIVEKGGVVKILHLPTGTLLAQPFLNLSATVASDYEQGLYAIAFPADYATSGVFYLSYTVKPAADSVLARYHVTGDPNVADPISGETLLRYPRPLGHYAGWIGFGPDGFLYYGSGDGGTFNNPDPLNRSQDITDQAMGKILRIDVNGPDAYPADPMKNFAIPPGNPFIGIEGDDEIWAYGLRQPWRCSFDSATGNLWIGEVGQGTWEEINIEPPAAGGFAGGRNYGWRCMEAADCTGYRGCSCGAPELHLPAFAYGHDLGCSITGGYVYHGCSAPELEGRYLFADYCSGRIWSMGWDGVTADVIEHTDELNPIDAPVASGIVSFGEDALGEVYICTYGGTVFRIGVAEVADCDQDGLPDECETFTGNCPDLNGDGSIGSADLAILLGAWGTGGPGDLNASGTVDSADLALLLGAWSA
jgi:glucose/arabinose dehydrogenase